MVDDSVELVAPHDFIHEVGLASHERVAKLCGSFKGHHNLCIHLKNTNCNECVDAAQGS